MGNFLAGQTFVVPASFYGIWICWKRMRNEELGMRNEIAGPPSSIPDCSRHILICAYWLTDNASGECGLEQIKEKTLD